jgi:hypothetical protein
VPPPLLKHPLLMQDKQRRERVAKYVRELSQEQLRQFGNWKDVEELGSSAQLNSIDVDDEEVFETTPEKFECLATLYVTLTAEQMFFEETLLATVRGSINEPAVGIESVQIDTKALSGETVQGQ